MRSSSIKVKSRPDQALLGAIIAGAIAVLLYRFTTSVEASLSRQMLSDHFSVCIVPFFEILFLVIPFCSKLNRYKKISIMKKESSHNIKRSHKI